MGVDHQRESQGQWLLVTQAEIAALSGSSAADNVACSELGGALYDTEVYSSGSVLQVTLTGVDK